MKKSNPINLNQSSDHLKWTDDKIYNEIKSDLSLRYENAKLEKICYENPFSESVHGSFTFLDNTRNTRHEVAYNVAGDDLMIYWEKVKQLNPR